MVELQLNKIGYLLSGSRSVLTDSRNIAQADGYSSVKQTLTSTPLSSVPNAAGTLSAWILQRFRIKWK